MSHTNAAYSHPTSDVSFATIEDLSALRATSVERIRLLVADPDPLARRALTDALRADGEFTVVGQSSTAVETVELTRHYRPALLLLAAALPDVDAIAVCERVVEASPDTRVVMLATVPDLDLEMRAMRAGASGFVVKSDEIESISRALSVVTAGHAIISPELTAVLVDRLRRTPVGGSGTRPVKSSLTDREWEVLDMICEGATTRDIAESLYLSPETVNSHAKSVLKKLGVHSRAAAVEAVSVLRGEVFS
jgi:two-component system, NarL family, response regulator LiaR